MIIQAIALSDQLDKDVNTFAMRVREWYGWHFPELVKICPDNHQYAQLAKLIGDKSRLSEDDLEDIQEILDDDETRARNVLDGARASMGSDISPIDLINISNFADRVVNLSTYRKALKAYLVEKMHLVAPNLSALLGETIGARLISHAGSLTNLAKYPASTVQILGAEKALFRALKTKGNTPKVRLSSNAARRCRSWAAARLRSRPTDAVTCASFSTVSFTTRPSSVAPVPSTRDASRVSSPTSARSPPVSTASLVRLDPLTGDSAGVASTRIADSLVESSLTRRLSSFNL
jgi:hypothetical protein